MSWIIYEYQHFSFDCVAAFSLYTFNGGLISFKYSSLS